MDAVPEQATNVATRSELNVAIKALARSVDSLRSDQQDGFDRLMEHQQRETERNREDIANSLKPRQHQLSLALTVSGIILAIIGGILSFYNHALRQDAARYADAIRAADAKLADVRAQAAEEASQFRHDMQDRAEAEFNRRLILNEQRGYEHDRDVRGTNSGQDEMIRALRREIDTINRNLEGKL